MDYSIPDDGVFNSVYRFYHPKWKSYVNTIFSLPSKTPLQVAYYRSGKFQHLINELSQSHDLIISHLIRVADYVKNANIPKIIEMTDAISMNYTRISEVKNNAGIKGLIYKIEKKRLNAYEKDIAKYFDYSVFVSQYDKNFLFENIPKLYERSIICSNGVDLFRSPYQFSPGGYKLIFIGNMQSAQNFDAAYWFAKEVLPIVRKHGPYEFHIIGKIPAENARKLGKIDGVIVIGAVNSVAEYATDALAGICSVRLAAGVQNKILEYMALGIPAITSSTGLEGLFAEDKKNILVADSPTSYVECILTLQKDHGFAELIAQRGYHYVKEQHSWSSKLKPLVDSINQLLQ
ncbi:glycosyltransferase [Pectobacterium versatile]|uniref:glycosyltransferase n=1 Tax=Pectobacterium versatile TaxID=2488639 RepID=UPI003868983E